MDVQAFLQSIQTRLQLSNWRGPKSTHMFPGKGKSDVGRCQNSAYREEGIDGDGTSRRRAWMGRALGARWLSLNKAHPAMISCSDNWSSWEASFWERNCTIEGYELPLKLISPAAHECNRKRWPTSLFQAVGGIELWMRTGLKWLYYEIYLY